jgi:hypothetical protein
MPVRLANPEFTTLELENQLARIARCLEQGRAEGRLVLGVALRLALAGPCGPTLVDPILPILLRHPTRLLAFEIVVGIARPPQTYRDEVTES